MSTPPRGGVRHHGAVTRRSAGLGLALAAALGGGAVLLGLVGGGPGGGTGRATGVVIAVEATSATRVIGFTLRLAGGAEEHFAIGGLETAAPAFPAVHLREHMVSLVPVVVSYRRVNGGRVATRLVDGPVPSAFPARDP